MIEKWMRKASNSVNAAACKWSSRVKGVKPGVWIILILMVYIVGRGSWMFHQRHIGHRDEIARAIGSTSFFYGTPQPDHSGSRIVYIGTSEEGVGLFTSDVSSGRRKTLNRWHTEEETLTASRPFPFSPDDTLFAYAFNDERTKYLAICESDSGKEFTRIETPEWIITEGVWLTPDKLAWIRRKKLVAGSPGVFQLHLIGRQPHGEWKDWSPDLTLTNASCLTSLSDDTVAWLDVNGIRAMNTMSKTVVTVLGSDKKRIREFSYCKSTGRFLLTRPEKTGSSLWRLKPNTNAPDTFDQLASDRNIRNAQWVNGGQGYAYLSRNVLVVNADGAEKAVRFPQATVDELVATSDGEQLVFSGAIGNEAGDGIWRYGVTSQALTNAVPYSDYTSSNAIRVEPRRCTFNDRRNQPLNYYIYRPAKFDRHKKYPLLIGDTFFNTHVYQGKDDGPSWAAAMAACGAYVVLIERKTWFLEDPDEWGTDVMSVYNQLISDPAIDAGKAYIYAASVETDYLSRLLKKRSESWEGIILFNPRTLPDVLALKPTGRMPRVLISAGEDEDNSWIFKQYQKRACGSGMLVEVVEHANSGHILTSIAAVRDRIRVLTDFVFKH